MDSAKVLGCAGSKYNSADSCGILCDTTVSAAPMPVDTEEIVFGDPVVSILEEPGVVAMLTFAADDEAIVTGQ